MRRRQHLSNHGTSMRTRNMRHRGRRIGKIRNNVSYMEEVEEDGHM
jgi:hypothetical protein